MKELVSKYTLYETGEEPKVGDLICVMNQTSTPYFVIEIGSYTKFETKITVLGISGRKEFNWSPRGCHLISRGT